MFLGAKADMDKRPLTTIVIGLGVLLIVASFVVSFLGGGTVRSATGWTQEKARQREEVGQELHRLAHEKGHSQQDGHGHGNPDASAEKKLDEQLGAAEKKEKEQRAQLNRAKSRGSLVITLLRFGGILIAGGGVIAYFLPRMLQD